MAGIYFVKLKAKQIVHQEEVGHAHTGRGHGGDLKLAVLGPHLPWKGGVSAPGPNLPAAAEQAACSVLALASALGRLRMRPGSLPCRTASHRACCLSRGVSRGPFCFLPRPVCRSLLPLAQSKFPRIVSQRALGVFWSVDGDLLLHCYCFLLVALIFIFSHYLVGLW